MNRTQSREDRREIMTSRYWVPAESRLIYPPGFVEHMPFRTVHSGDELHELKMNLDFNPTKYYEATIKLVGGEVGYDRTHRILIWEQAPGKYRKP